MADRDRVRPTTQARARLLAAVEAGTPTCAVDPGTLGEYAAVLAASGLAAADAAFPETARHLQAGCTTCPDDLRDLLAMLREPDDEPASGPASPSLPGLDDSDVRPADLRRALLAEPDVSLVTDRPAAPERPALPPVVPRRHLTRRDWLLIAAATVVLLVGLALIVMAYLSLGRAGSSPTGRVAPAGLNCPSTHPIKGNRESMIYHRPGDEFYDRTRPEDCFATPADAEAAGYRLTGR